MNTRSAKAKIKLGQIGCGAWGPNLIRNFYQLPDCIVDRVCDLREERLNYIQSIYPGVKTTRNNYRPLNNPGLYP